MRTRRQFRPSGSSILEDRIALSSAAVADVASAATVARNVRLTFQGNFVTVPPQGIGGGDTTSLGGAARFPQVGTIRLVGALQSNPSVAPPFSRLRGALVISVPGQTGSAVVGITGPATDLSPAGRSLTPVAFRVVTATGVFSSFTGLTGTGNLLLRSRPVGSPGGLVSGRFTLQLVQS